MKTGFEAYWIYIATKIHFETNYDISEKGFPNKDKLLKKWNDERVNKDGKLFAEIHNKVQKKKDLLYLFSIYYLIRGKFYIKDIIDDDYAIFDRLKEEFINIEDNFVNDTLTLIEVCMHNRMTIKDFFTKHPEQAFTLKVSPLSLIIFNIMFNFTDNIDLEKINILSRKKIEDKKNRIDKFQKIVYNDLCKVDWTTKFKEALGR